MGDQVLLAWYDVFDLPIWLSKELPEDRVRAFCSTLRLHYEESSGRP